MIALTPTINDPPRKDETHIHESFTEKSEDEGYTVLIVACGNPLILANNSKCSLAVNASHRMSN
jgi:hypothetical protein